MAIFDVDFALRISHTQSQTLLVGFAPSINLVVQNGTTLTGAAHVPIVESLLTDDVVTGNIINIIMERIAASTSLSSNGSVFLQFISESFVTDDIAKGIVQLIIQEGLTIDDVLTNYRVYYDLIAEFCRMNGLLFSTGTFIGAISVAFSIADIVTDPEIVGEGMSIGDSVLENIAALGAIIEAMTITAAASEQMSLMCLIGESFSIADDISATGIFQALIEENISFGLVVTIDGTVYEGWLMNAETLSVWNYNNFDFNSITRFGDHYLMANANGLWEMEGAFDDGEAIIAKIKTASMDFGISGLKQISQIILGVVSSGKLVLKVSVDGQQTVYYELKAGTNGLENQKIKLGKGLHGRYWQFELITKDNSDLDLDSFEALPYVFGRRLR